MRMIHAKTSFFSGSFNGFKVYTVYFLTSSFPSHSQSTVPYSTIFHGCKILWNCLWGLERGIFCGCNCCAFDTWPHPLSIRPAALRNSFEKPHCVPAIPCADAHCATSASCSGVNFAHIPLFISCFIVVLLRVSFMSRIMEEVSFFERGPLASGREYVAGCK